MNSKKIKLNRQPADFCPLCLKIKALIDDAKERYFKKQIMDYDENYQTNFLTLLTIKNAKKFLNNSPHFRFSNRIVHYPRHADSLAISISEYSLILEKFVVLYRNKLPDDIIIHALVFVQIDYYNPILLSLSECCFNACVLIFKKHLTQFHIRYLYIK